MWDAGKHEGIEAQGRILAGWMAFSVDSEDRNF
jgi:hypothetical protein